MCLLHNSHLLISKMNRFGCLCCLAFMQGRKLHTEKLFLSFQLSERVPEDNFYRKLKSFLNLHWLYKATKKYYGSEGQQSIDPIVFFKLMLIGYLENLGSDRRIINTASMRLDMLFFLGYEMFHHCKHK